MKKLLCSLVLLLSFSSTYSWAADEYCHDYFKNCELGTFSAGADYLYWKTEGTNLSYGTAINYIDNVPTFTTEYLRPNFQYDSGFRVFGDYQTKDDLWKLCLSFTHMPSSAKNYYFAGEEIFSQFANVNDRNFSLLLDVEDVDLNILGANYHSKVNYLDFDISSSYDFCNHLEMVPYLGLRALWMKQNMGIEGAVQEDAFIFNSRYNSKLSGYGIKGGLKGVWRFYEGFSLVGHLGGSILYARIHTSGKLLTSNSGVVDFADSFSETSHRGIPMFDSFIGLNYDACVYGYETTFLLGWEQHIIYQAGDFSQSRHGNTTLQGLTVGGSVSF